MIYWKMFVGLDVAHITSDAAMVERGELGRYPPPFIEGKRKQAASNDPLESVHGS